MDVLNPMRVREIASGTGPLLAVIQSIMSGAGPILATISGQPVDVSVTVTVETNISGQSVVVTSGRVRALVSGDMVKQGGVWGVQVSGAVRVSGAVQVSGIVDIETPTTIVNFQQIIPASGVQLTAGVVKTAAIKAMSANSGFIYLGTSGVLPTTGFELDDGEAVDLDIDNTNRLYGIASVSGDRICVLGVV